MKKLVLGILASMLFIPSVYASTPILPIEEDPSNKLWKIEDITSNDTLIGEKGTISTKGKTTTINYSGREFRLITGTGECTDPSSSTKPACQNGTNRPYGYSWIGFRIAPLDEDGNEVKDGTFKVKLPNGDNFNVLEKDGGNKIEYSDFVGINADYLKKALKNNKKVTYTYNFEYTPDKKDADAITHTVRVEVDPATTILYKVNSTGTDTGDIEYNGPNEKKELDASRTQKTIDTPKVKVESNKNNTINTIVIVALLVVSVGVILYIIKKSNQ